MQGYRLTRCRCDDHPRLRKLALEFLIVLAEKAGSMARRCKLLVEQAVPLALTLMCTIEDDPEWNDKVRTRRQTNRRAAANRALSPVYPYRRPSCLTPLRVHVPADRLAYGVHRRGVR